MSTLNLDKIFLPKRIAVIGAGKNPSSVGHIVFKNLVSSEFDGAVFPVNPKGENVEGVGSYSSVSEIPEQVDLAIIATPAKTVPELIEDCGKSGILGVIVLSAGFKETGEEGRKLEEKILKSARPYGIRIIGPNCLGVIVPGKKMNATFTPFMPVTGKVALISQSGALCSAILDRSIQERIGFSSFISIGHMIDVDFGDLIDYLGTDGQTHSILLYIESLTNARKFMSAARAFAKKKPIVVVKSGRFSESFEAAVSHTGALAGEDLVYDAAFQRAGMVRVEEVKDLFNCAEILAKQRRPLGPKLVIITNAGGPGVMAADALIKYGGELAALSKETMDELNGFLPSFWSHGNPIDILGDAPPERFGRVLEIILEDKGTDGVLVILTPQTMTDSDEVAHSIGEVSKNSMKPVLTSWMGGGSVQGGIEILNQRNIPTYPTPEEAAKTFTYMYSYGHNLELLYETPEEIPIDFEFDRMKDGTPIILRPIKPEDEPLWLELLEGLSLETMRLRFFNVGQKITHEMAVRYCFIDYEREIAMVAQMHQDRGKKLIGVGRLVTNPDMETAELAVVVGDPWQGKGVGSLLTDCCIEIAKERRIKRMVGDILADNEKMLGMFQRRGFKVKRERDIIRGTLSFE